MCSNTKTSFNFNSPATEEGIETVALRFVHMPNSMEGPAKA
jgi:hypothetical protein